MGFSFGFLDRDGGMPVFLKGELEAFYSRSDCAPNVEPEETTPGRTALSNGLNSHVQEKHSWNHRAVGSEEF
jgi:hypothetical protein